MKKQLSELPASRFIFATGLKFFKNGEYQAAIMQFSSALLKNKRLKGVYEYRGRANMQLGEYSKAIFDLKRALVESPKSRTYQNLGICHACMGDLRTAEDVFLEGLGLNEKSPDLYYQLAFLYEQQQAAGLAQTYYELAVTYRKKFLQAWVNLASIHYEQERYEIAADCYRKALFADRKNPTALENLSRVYQVLGRDAERKRILARLLLACPESKIIRSVNVIDHDSPYSEMNCFTY